MEFARKLLTGLTASAPFTAIASSTASQSQGTARAGVTGLWVLANISCAGMRAQNSASAGWRIIAFIFGLPGTFISFLAITEGSERAYGIEVPRRRTRGPDV
ncbi:hypothetical protein [Stenotrophomonas sp. Iso1]|uniref:hypothetical protein n=1 Tax=Stenotrophomonas sp. Iso1 TaxID=2977283 RepID=UPI0022B7C072|nr:hypothetical protein [Stenotrophomonas sp. Iso1]